MTVTIAPLEGSALKIALPDLARLRIEVFRDWPYLYDGSYDYERNYIADFAASPGGVIVIARDGGRIIGAATGTPLRGGHAEEFAAPFAGKGYDLDRLFYLGESVLLRAYRGRGIGVRFFELREAHARSLGGFTHATFCSVIRPESHPLRAPDYVPLDAFWRKRGYEPVPSLVGSFSWQDIGDGVETAKPMQYWMKAL